MTLLSTQLSRRKAVWGPKRARWVVALLLLGLSTSAMAAGAHPAAHKAKPDAPNSHARRGTLDHDLTSRAARNPGGTSQVIVTLQPGALLPPEFKRYAKKNGQLGIINGHVLSVPNGLLKQFAAHPAVFQIDDDRPIGKHNFRTSLTVGAAAVQRAGFTGAGVGVAVIDSGVTTWHDDLTNRSTTLYPYGNQRVAAFVDFVNGLTTPYDDDGHGTHVAGVIAGNGYDSNGREAGMAPDAGLVSLKVLDANGTGTISNIIAAFDWIVANHAQYNIRVVNLSTGAAVRESYWTDPLTLAAKRVVDAGVVVVTAAGNLGQNLAGLPQYGGISAPANAPWVITVGASSTMGTPDRADDTMASFSSRGPTYKDWAAKPDLVAPGVGTVSLADPQSQYYVTRAAALLPGSIATAYLPYLSLSGTSMASPVVAGTVALMLEANPSLTPNAVKAILEYTAQVYPGYNALTEGAGFLNTLGAVRLARFFATAQPGQVYPTQAMWSKHLIWGNHQLTGGILQPTANAFQLGVTWGAAKTDTGDNIVWGTAATDTNIVWGTDCGGADCDNIVWGTVDSNNIVWGTADVGDNIVWGTACTATACNDANIVWSTADGDNIVWGTACTDATCDNIVWGTADGGDNIVWGTATSDGVTWSAVVGTVRVTHWRALLDALTDEQIFAIIRALYYHQFVAPPPPPPPPPPDPATTTTATATDPVTGVTTTSVSTVTV